MFTAGPSLLVVGKRDGAIFHGTAGPGDRGGTIVIRQDANHFPVIAPAVLAERVALERIEIAIEAND